MSLEDDRALALAALRLARPRQYDAIILLRQGLKQTDIAAQLGVTQGRVSQLLARAANNLEKLRERVATASAGKRDYS